jgi:hypothetical protein
MEILNLSLSSCEGIERRTGWGRALGAIRRNAARVDWDCKGGSMRKTSIISPMKTIDSPLTPRKHSIRLQLFP